LIVSGKLKLIVSGKLKLIVLGKLKLIVSGKFKLIVSGKLKLQNQFFFSHFLEIFHINLKFVFFKKVAEFLSQTKIF